MCSLVKYARVVVFHIHVYVDYMLIYSDVIGASSHLDSVISDRVVGRDGDVRIVEFCY